MELKEIKRNLIWSNQSQLRREFDQDKLNELASNIKAHGLIEPVVVAESEKGYQLVAGERRLRACKLAGMTIIPAVVKRYGSEADLKRDRLVENELRENLTDSEFKAFVFSLAESLGEPYFVDGRVNATRLAEYVVGGENPHSSPFRRKVNKVVRVWEHAPISGAVEKGELDLDTAASISGVEDSGAQEELLEMARTKPRAEVRAKAANYKKKHREGKAEATHKAGLAADEDFSEVEDAEPAADPVADKVKGCKGKVKDFEGRARLLAEVLGMITPELAAGFSEESKAEYADSLSSLMEELRELEQAVKGALAALSGGGGAGAATSAAAPSF